MVGSAVPYRGEIDLEAVFGWLSPDHWRFSFLSRTARLQLDLLKQYRDEANLEDAESLVQEILGAAQSHGDLQEEAEARLRAALVLYRLGGTRQAYELLHSAATQFQDRWHFHGAVQWLLGIVMLKVQNLSSALSALESGAEAFSDLRYESIINKRWYRRRLDEMESLIKHTNATGRYDHDIPGADYFFPRSEISKAQSADEAQPQLTISLSAQPAAGVSFSLVVQSVQALHRLERVYTQIFMAQSESPSAAVWYKGVLHPLSTPQPTKPDAGPQQVQHQVKSLFQVKAQSTGADTDGSPMRIRELVFGTTATISVAGHPDILQFIAESVGQFKKLQIQRSALGPDVNPEVQQARWMLFHNQVKFIDRLPIPADLKKRLMKSILDDLEALAQVVGLQIQDPS
jgi:tetratricopeptide (TPR) repeat protein